jgi:hypothetical protein
MSTPLPNPADVAQLLAFLPQRYSVTPQPASCQQGTEREVINFGASHRTEIEAFFQLAGSKNWSDHDYSPEQMSDPLQQPGGVESAVPMQLTLMVRGERFCDDHRGATIEPRAAAAGPITSS